MLVYFLLSLVYIFQFGLLDYCSPLWSVLAVIPKLYVTTNALYNRWSQMVCKLVKLSVGFFGEGAGWRGERAGVCGGRLLTKESISISLSLYIYVHTQNWMNFSQSINAVWVSALSVIALCGVISSSESVCVLGGLSERVKEYILHEK